MVAIKVHRHIQIHNVPNLQGPAVWDPVADALIHARAQALRELACMPQVGKHLNLMESLLLE